MNLNQIVWLDFDYMNNHYEAEAIPTVTVYSDDAPAFEIYLDNEYSGTVMKDCNRYLNNYVDKELFRIIQNKLIPFFID